MPLQIVGIDSTCSESNSELWAWALYPKDHKARRAYLTALRFERCKSEAASGRRIADWAWDSVETLASTGMTVQQILADGSARAAEPLATASTMLWGLLDGRFSKVKEAAAAHVTKEIRDYKRRKGARATQLPVSRVMHEHWGRYKCVAHLALAFRIRAIQKLPPELRNLPPEQVHALLWKIECGQADPDLVKPPLTADDVREVLRLAEEFRQRAIAKPRLRFREAETIKFVAVS